LFERSNKKHGKKKMADEKVTAYIKKCLDAGKMAEAIDTSKITGAPLSKEEINVYIQKYLENGWMQKAIDGAKAAGIELSKDVLSGYVNKYLENEKIYSAVDAARIIGVPLPREKIAVIGKECLRKGKITSALEAYKIIKEKPPEEELIICGNICFKNGLLADGLEAYRLANKTPPEDELVICGNACFNIGHVTPGLDAYKLANKNPSKEMLRICGEACLLEQRNDDARKAFVAAQKVEEMICSRTIEVREISLSELKKSNIDISGKCFGQKFCWDCENSTDIKERYFEVSRCPQTKEDEEELDKIMKLQHEIVNFYVELDVLGNGRGLINSSICGNCGSKNVVLSSGDEMGYMEIKAGKK